MEWKESDQRKDMRSLFVSNATEFDNVIPIDRVVISFCGCYRLFVPWIEW
ncbi:MAG: hypothetical protein ACLU4J_13155 [Butyricimonas paravirosa]